ncbi:Protein adenylyltransferase SelO-1, mitochondrial [Geodia barretti]|uniref:Selenoprotein O n=1 Tax=Geodia barretti TaxID=519541 RepID=A0AA35WR41_GEOBA|nr:Protein adenylyltransferase SelO-1, mitochondrial [Geodia barretti]
MLSPAFASRFLSLPSLFTTTRRHSLPLSAGLPTRRGPLLSRAAALSSPPPHAATDCNMSSLEDLVFDNRALKSLPIDPETQNYVRSVAGACFSRVRPTPLSNPRLVVHSPSALHLVGLSPDQLSRPGFVEYMSGNKILPGSEPASHCYCGHQFGHFSGQLGDGCAHYLGEVVGPGGQRWELQLKGSGKTPYSRFADGRKVLRSSIREFLCSEAMHYLGIPTTRAGSCITSDDTVTRDILYSGHPIQERCTVITRIAPTFIRFGSFEIFKTRDRETGRVGPSVGREDILHQLLDFVTQSYYPQVHIQEPEDRRARTALFFRDLCVRTAHLVSAWQCVGFCHGLV